MPTDHNASDSELKNQSTLHGGESVLPLLTGAGVFLVYLRTLAPTIVGGDTGEFAAVACSTGVAHPPGYPLFTILAKLFTFIPFGTVGWRVNLLSAVCGALAAVVILLAVRKWTNNQWAGLVAAGLFAFSPLTWRYAVTAEVFSLNNLLIATMVYLTVRFAIEGRIRDAYLFALVFGLGIANHLTCIFYGIPLLVWLFVRGKRELWNVGNLLKIAGCFCLGLLPYAYLPIADSFKPAFSWGNTSTLQGFVTHLLRTEFGSIQLGANTPGAGGYFLIGLIEYFKALPSDVHYIGVVLVGCAVLSRRNGRLSGLAITLAIAYVFYLIVFHALANLPIDQSFYLRVHSRFWQQSNLLICICAGLGFDAIASLLPQMKWRREVPAVVAVLIVAGAAAFSFKSEDQHLNTAAADFGREFLRPLPANSILWSREDLVTFPLAYLQQCEGYRKDVVVLDRELLRTGWIKQVVDRNYPTIALPGAKLGPDQGGYAIGQLFDANQNRANQFINRLENDPSPDNSWRSAYELWPLGMTSWILPRRSQMDHSFVTQSHNALPQLDLNLLTKHPDGSWENEMLKYYWEARLNRANHLISYAHANNDDRVFLEAGAAALEEVLTALRLRDLRLFKTLGFAYQRLSRYDGSYDAKMKSAWKRYLELNPPEDDPGLNEIKNAVNN